MKILLIHQYFKEDDVTGGARFNEMTRLWKEAGHSITVIAGDLDGQSAKKRSEYKGNFIKKKVQNGIVVWRCNVSESYNSNFLGRLWGYFSFVISGTWAVLFKIKGDYDLVLTTSPPLFVGIIGYVASLKKRVPLIFEVRDLWPESAIDTGVLKNKIIIKLAYWFEGFIYKKAKLINVLTPAFKRILVEEKNIDINEIIMIPNAADFSMSDSILKSFDVSDFRAEKGWEDKFVITYVGAHGVANGLFQVLDVAKRLKDTNVLFVLIGTGMTKAGLEQRILDENIQNVQFFDPMPKAEVLRYVRASQMGTSVLTKNDTFKTVYSNKTFDYMSCQKPILMVIDGVSRDLVEDAKAGVFIEPENIDDFESKIREYLNKSEELLAVKGLNGYKHAKTNFDRNKLAMEYLELLKKEVNV